MPKKILVVDDSITIQKVFTYTFKEDDVSVTTVGDPHAAVEKAKEILPDLVVVALTLPQKSGYEVFQEITRIPALQGVIGLVLLTANESYLPEEAQQAGISDFLVKPFDTQTLTNKVKSLLSQTGEEGQEVEEPQEIAPLPPDDEPSLIRFTRSELGEPSPPPAAPEPTLAETVDSEDIQVIEHEHAALEFEELDSTSLKEDEAEAEAQPEESELVSLDAITDEVEDLSGVEEEVMELEEIELVDEPEEEMEMSADSFAEGKVEEVDDLEFDIVSEIEQASQALENEAKEEPTDLDLSDLEEIPLAEEVEEIEEIGGDDEFVPVAELSSEEDSGGTESISLSEELDGSSLEEVPEEIPYLEEVQEEMGIEELDMGTLENDLSEPDTGSADVLGMGGVIPEIDSIDMDMVEELPSLDAGEEVSDIDEEPAESLEMEEELPGDLSPAPAEILEAGEATPPAGLADSGDFEGEGIRVKDISQTTASAIEKVVWEVIPDLAEKLVRELVKERLEQVAWEVIPDLAEQLIREEIQRLEEGIEREK